MKKIITKRYNSNYNIMKKYMFGIFPSHFERIHNSLLVLNSMKIENNIQPLFTRNNITNGLFRTKYDKIYECPIYSKEIFAIQILANISFILIVFMNGKSTPKNVLCAGKK